MIVISWYIQHFRVLYFVFLCHKTLSGSTRDVLPLDDPVVVAEATEMESLALTGPVKL